MQFLFPCLFFALCMYSSQNSLQVSKMCHLCWFTYLIICWEWPFLIEFAGGFIMFLRWRQTQWRRSINNWGYPDPFKPKILLLTDGDRLLTRKDLENVGSFHSKTPIYSLWVWWCFFKSGTLPLTLHKFNKIVYFSKFLRKTPRRAKPILTAGENPLLMTLRTKT